MSKFKSADDPVEPVQTVKPLGPPRIFRDTVFTSRTLVLPNGSTASVTKGQVTAFGDDQFAYFSTHPDLELMPE